MKMNLMRSLSVLAVAALPLAGLTATFTVVGAEAVYAGGGNGNGNGNGNGRGNGGGRSSDRGSDASEGRGNGHGRGHGAEAGDEAPGNGRGNGRGAIASELKGLNACHASNEARANAAPNSQVGRIATYASAAETTQVSYEEWQAAYSEYEAFEGSYDGRSSTDIQADIDTLDQTSETYDADLATLTTELEAAVTYETQLAELGTAANEKMETYEAAAEQEETALSDATGGRELSPEATEALRVCLEG